MRPRNWPATPLWTLGTYTCTSSRDEIAAIESLPDLTAPAVEPAIAAGDPGHPDLGSSLGSKGESRCNSMSLGGSELGRRSSTTGSENTIGEPKTEVSQASWPSNTLHAQQGGVAEWPNAAVLKTAVPQGTGGFESSRLRQLHPHGKTKSRTSSMPGVPLQRSSSCSGQRDSSKTLAMYVGASGTIVS